jgi:hypothetical protein
VADNQHDIVLTLDASAFERGIQQAIAILSSLGQTADSISVKLQNIVSSINVGNFTNQINAANKATSELGNNALGLSKIQEVLQKATGVTEPLVQGLQSVGTKAGEATANIRSLITSTEGASTDKVTKPLLTGMEAAQKAIKNTSVTIDDLVARVEAAGRRIETVSEKEFKGFVRSLEAQRQSIQNQRINTAGNDDSFKIDRASDTTVLVGLAKAIETVKQRLKETGQEVSDFTLKKLAVIELNKEFEHAKNIIFGVTKASRELGTALNDIRPPENFVGPLSRDQTQQIAALDKATLILNQDQQNADRIARQYGLSLEELNQKLAQLLNTASKTEELKGLNKELSNLAKPVTTTPVTPAPQPGAFVGPPNIQAVEAVAKAQQIVKQNFELISTAANKAGKSIDEVTKQIAKQIQTAQAQKAKQGLNEVVNSLTGVGTEAKKTAGLLDYLVRGLEIGVAHSVGAISVGANVIRSLTHEIIRNLSISVFNFGLKNFKASLDESTDSLKNVAQAAGDIAAPAKRASETLSEIGNAAGGAGGAFSTLFKSINFGLLAISGGLILVGSLIDKLGDKLFAVGTDLAKKSGDFSVNLAQLNAVIDANEKSTGRALGSNEQWRESLIGISAVSGKSISDLSQLSASFIGIDKDAELSAQGIQSLVESAAVLSPLFRNQIELLTNFRGALLGNFRAINGNIFVANNQVDANQRFIRSLVQQGKSQEEANKIAGETSQIEKNRAVIIEAAAARVDLLKNSTDLLNVANLRLQGSMNALLATMGKGAESILARFNNFLAKILELASKLPEPLLASVGAIALVSGSLANVGGKILKLAGFVGVLTVAFTALNAVMVTTIPLLGTSLLYALNGVATKFGASLSLSTTFTQALRIIAGAIVGTYLPAILKFIAATTLIGTVITAAIIGFNAFSDSMGGLGNAFSALLAPISAVLTILGTAKGDLQLAARATAAYTVVVSALGRVFADTALAAVIFAKSLIATRQLFGDTEALRSKQAELDEQFKRVRKSQDDLNLAMEHGIKTMFASSEAIKKQKEELEQLRQVMIFTRGLNKQLSLGEEQQKAFDRLKQTIQDQVEQLRIRNVELTSGKAAAAQERLNAAVIKGVEAVKKAGEDKGEKKLTDGQIEALKEQLRTAILGGEVIAAENDKLAEQNALVKKITENAEKLHNSLQKQFHTLGENILSEQSFGRALRDSNETTDNIVKDLERGRKVLDEQAKIYAQIEVLQEELKQSRNADGELINISDVRKVEIIERNIQKLKEAVPNIAFRVDTEQALSDSNKFFVQLRKEIDNISDKFADSLKIGAKQIEIQKQFNTDLAVGVEFAEQRRQVRLKELELDQEIAKLEKDIISGKTRGDNVDAIISRLSRLEVLKKKGQLVDQESARISVDANNRITQSLREQEEALLQQLTVLEGRSKLFAEGVLTGQFSKTTNQISILTSSLEQLINDRAKLARQIDIQNITGINLGVEEKQLNAVIGRVEELKEALKGLNVIATIEEVLHSVGDAINTAITDGVRGVAEGTQTIKELFRNMASNILLSISSISAKKALDILKNQFSEFAASLADSDIAKKIAGLFGIKLDSLKSLVASLTGKVASPNATLEAAIIDNTITAKGLSAAVTNLTTAITTQNANPTTGQNPLNTTPTGTPNTAPTSTGTFTPTGAIASTTGIPGQGPDTGTTLLNATLTQTNALLTTLNSSLTTIVQSIITTLGQTNTLLSTLNGLLQQIIVLLTQTNGFLAQIVGQLQPTAMMLNSNIMQTNNALRELNSSIINLINTQSGANEDSTMLFFKTFTDTFGKAYGGGGGGGGGGGMAAGGLVSGTPSKKDNKLLPMASGEFVVNPEATKYYGDDLLNAINNQQLPTGLWDMLETNSVSNKLMQTKASLPPTQNTNTVQDDRPINITIIDKSHKLDPASFKMKPDEVTSIIVDGIKKDKVMRKVIREDIANGGSK